MNKIIALFIVVITPLLILSPGEFAAQAQDCQFEAEPIRIGATGPLSSPGAVQGGRDMQWAFQLAESDINADCGIELGGLHYPVEIIFRDTAGTPDVGVTVARDLIENEHVVALVGEYHSAVALAMMEVTAETNLPTVFAETWNDDITAKGYPNVFRIAPTSTYASTASLFWLVVEGATDVVLIVEDTDFGVAAASTGERLLYDFGVSVDIILVETGTEDFSDILAPLLERDPPDAIDTSLVTGEANLRLVQQITELGLAPTADTICVANQAALTPEFWEMVPNGTYCIVRKIGLGPNSYNELATRIAGQYAAELGTNPPHWVFEAYDSVWLVADAIERAGTTEAEAVNLALETTDLQLAQGRYYFEYTSLNPLQADVPAYMWHQWPEPVVLLVQYTAAGQSSADAPVIWPLNQMHQPYMRPD